ncbi:unnamed protein product [Caenorhabditis nigoni]
MRYNCVNVILIGIGLCDMANVGNDFYKHVAVVISGKCSSPYSYLFTIFDFWTPAIADDARRCRTWFAFLMALLRYLILRSDLNPKLRDISKPKVVLKIMMVPFVISTCICTNYPSGYSQMTFISKVAYGLYYYSLPVRIFNLVDGILKLIPTLMFPLLTFLLIHELRRTKNSIKMSQGIKQEDSKGDHTTKLVVMMTISFMTAESPFGIIYFMEGVITEPPGFISIIQRSKFLFETFVIINATSHFLVCLLVSSPYRKAVKEMFCKAENQRKQTTVILL